MTTTTILTRIIFDDPSPGDGDWLRAVANRLITLGHLVLRQGADYECARCGASGTAERYHQGAELTGTIAAGPCQL